MAVAGVCGSGITCCIFFVILKKRKKIKDKIANGEENHLDKSSEILYKENNFR